jgi:hypothetical protein
MHSREPIVTTITIQDSVLGKLTIPLPAGYRHVPREEYRKRMQACRALEDAAENEQEWAEAWDDIGGVRLWDHCSGELLPTSSMPYRWRVMVEPITEDNQV